jgi:pectate lyase
MKKLLLYLTILLSVGNSFAQTITKESGWLESAFVEWEPVAGADSYNVYYTGGGKTNIKIDEQLIRSYGSYFRADVPGLAAGPYTLTIKPVTGLVEGTGATTGSLNVLPQDRNGFAFDSGRIPGGYKADGTPKAGAIILYITQNTKNTISYDIVTSTKLTKTNYIGLQNILYGIKKGLDTRPFIFRLIGNITDMTVMEGGDITIENAQNQNSYLTIEGIGSDAVVNGMGIRLKSASNIEVRNLGFMNCNSEAGDNVGMQQDNDHIWIHNCDMFYGNAGSDADQVKGDGALDNKNSTFCTFSYNHFWDNGKCSLLGLSEGTTAGLYVTYHHNWFDHSDSRHPRVRYYSAHVYNNYYDGNSKYGVGSTMGSSVFVEGNYFRNCKHPMMTSYQGTDAWDETLQKDNAAADGVGTFSGEAGGIIKEINNKFIYDATAISKHYNRFVSYGAKGASYDLPGNKGSFVDFDAYSADNREELVPNTVKSSSGKSGVSSVYNNFDTDPALYVANLKIDTPDDAKTNVMQYAGRVSGGDLKFTYVNNVDDYESLVNNVEKTAVTNYKTTMVAVQGETVAPGNQTLVASTNNNNQTVSSGIAISNIVFTWGGDATDATATGLPNGVVAVKNTNAKTLTLSGTPTETMEYTVTTTGSIGSAASDSGTITVLPASTQVLISTSNNNQTIVKGKAITNIVLTWDGTAEDADVTGLPDGVNFVKNTSNKTITISGTPTAKGVSTFTAITSGSVGTPVAISGTITVNLQPSGSQIHNVSISGNTTPTGSFYAMSAAMNNATNPSPPTVAYTENYTGTNTLLSLSKCLKIDSSLSITFVTAGAATLTLVLDPSGDATKRIYVVPTGTLVATQYSYTAVNGIITVSLPTAGSYTILKRDTANLYYIKTSYDTTLGIGDNIQSPKLALYPNPVNNQLNISSADQKVKNVTIYNILGAVVKNIPNEVESIDMSNLSPGTYLVKLTTDQGTSTQKIVKK